MSMLKKFLCCTIIFSVIICTNTYAYRMYSLDGRSVEVNYDDAQAWRDVNWYDQPVHQVYSLDGRTEIIYKSQIDSWKSVGWYEEPVQIMYAPDGRTEIIYKTQVDAWKSVGWYEEPVQIMYAPDGRTEIIYKTQVDAWKSVGWYTYPVKHIYARNVENALKNYALNKKSIVYTYYESTTYEKKNLRFKLCDLTNDGINELIAVGCYENELSQIEIFYYDNGEIKSIYNFHCGGMAGCFSKPVMYKEEIYIMYESFSSSNGFLQRLMRFNGESWYDIYSSYMYFDYSNRGEFMGYYINDCEVSESEYNSLRSEVENSYMTIYDFVKANEL